MNKTLFRYIFINQLKFLVFLSFFIFCLILLFDFAEVTRKFPVSNFSEVCFAVRMASLRAPITFCEILNYIYFVAATFSLWNLCNSNQVTILKSSGKSPQQILYPFVIFSFFISSIWLFVAHPIGLDCEKMYHQSISANNTIGQAENHNVWIDYKKENQLIFIKTINNQKIDGLCIFDNVTNERIFAKHADIDENYWSMTDVTVIADGKIKNVNKSIRYNTISSELINLLSKPPHKHDIYQLQKLYKIQQDNQIEIKLYKFTLHLLLAYVASFFMFALAAAVVCFPINRHQTKSSIMIKVVGFTIVFRFLNNIFQSLAHGGVLSMTLAAWATVLILLLFSIALLVWKEA